VAVACYDQKSDVTGGSAQQRFSSAKPVSNRRPEEHMKMKTDHRECGVMQCVGGVDETGDYVGKVTLKIVSRRPF
jgi:hypothetical protein